jgi:hypothetical protein
MMQYLLSHLRFAFALLSSGAPVGVKSRGRSD